MVHARAAKSSSRSSAPATDGGPAALSGPPTTRATHDAVRATILGVLLLLCLGSVFRLASTAVAYGIPAWFDEELNPLLNLLARGQPIGQIDARQYGVLVFLVFDPAVRILGANASALAVYAAAVSVVATVVAFVLMARRFADDPPRLLVLAILWSSAVPLLYVVAQHMVDAWQLCFLSLSLFLLTGSPKQQRVAGLPLAAATMTKLLPALLVVYLFVRSWRAGLLAVAGVAVLLAIGQVVYGTLMGFGYPLAMLSMGGETVARWSTHWENNSIRGLLFKLAAGFRLESNTTAYVIDQRWFPVLSVVSYLVAAALVGYLLFAAWRGRAVESVARRSIEFSLAIVTMLLISPHTAQDYLVTALPVLAVWLWLWWGGLPRPWGIGQTALAVLAALLIGVFVPMNAVARVLPFGWLLSVTQNAHNVLFIDQIGSAIGAYDFFGFPGVGILLAWFVMLRLERQSRIAEQPRHGIGGEALTTARQRP
jgi:hypothetical protein